MHTHRNISETYILGRWGENSQYAGQGLPRGKIKKSTQSHFTCFSLHQYLTLKSFLFLLRKAELTLLLSCSAICQKETVSLLSSAAGKVRGLISWRRVSRGCVRTAHGWKVLPEHWHEWPTPECGKVGGVLLLGQQLGRRRTCAGACGTETCTSTAARDRYTMSLAPRKVSSGERPMGVLRAWFLTACDSLDVKRWLLNFSVLIWQ